MAKYTIELNTLLNTNFDIGLESYPIPSFADETWRNRLNQKIINHYRYREICHTAPDRWKLYLNNTMNEIMPVKCLMYEALAENWKFNTGSDFTEVIAEENKFNTTSNGTSDANSSGNSYSLGVQSDTPGQLLNVENEIESNTYASNASKSKGDASSTAHTASNSSGNSSGERNLTRTHKGVASRSNASLYREYQEAINNIDMEVIDALETCFMSIF